MEWDEDLFQSMIRDQEREALEVLAAEPTLLYCWRDGDPPFHFAIRKGMALLVQAMLELGQDVDARNGLGESGLHTLARMSQEGGLLAGAHPILACLKRYGANPRLLNAKGEPPLVELLDFFPPFRDRPAVLELYLQLGADPNQPDRKGWTSLHHLCDMESIGDPAMASVLVAAGADRRVESNEGLTPHDVLLRRTASGLHLDYLSKEAYLEMEALVRPDRRD